MVKKKVEIWSAIGRRKSSVARVRLYSGKGKITVNKRPVDEYFGRDTLKMVMRQPFEAVELLNKYDVEVRVNGGCLTGQAGAIRLGLARSIEKINPDFRKVLKEKGMLTRDSREVERKKPGQPGARKKFQFSKR